MKIFTIPVIITILVISGCSSPDNEQPVSDGMDYSLTLENARPFLQRTIGGDTSIESDVSLEPGPSYPNRGAGLVIRDGNAAESPYAGVAIRGNGSLTFQYREIAGGEISSISTSISLPTHLRLSRDADVISLEAVQESGRVYPIGSVSIEMSDSVQIGVFHFRKVQPGGEADTAAFSSSISPSGELVVDQTIVFSQLVMAESLAGN